MINEVHIYFDGGWIHAKNYELHLCIEPNNPFAKKRQSKELQGIIVGGEEKMFIALDNIKKIQSWRWNKEKLTQFMHRPTLEDILIYERPIPPKESFFTYLRRCIRDYFSQSKTATEED